ncbi:MAG: choice-of-anchor P family protein [Candidatus Binatia bacterium]
MRYRIVSLGLSLLLAGTVSTAQAQVIAQGQAQSSAVFLLGAEQGLLSTGNTQLQTATEPDDFAVTAQGASVDVPGVASVISAASSTAGRTSGSNPRVISNAGEVTADVLNGTVRAVTTGSQAIVSCRSASADADVNVLRIGTDVIDIPADPAPNTVIDVAGVARVTLNRQVFTPNQAAGTVTLTVDAALIEVLSGGQILEVVLSRSAAALAGLRSDCPIFTRGLTTTGGGDGGGGCALNPSAPGTEAWPVFLLALLWILHRWRRTYGP